MSGNLGREHTWKILRDVVKQLDPRQLVAEAVTRDEDGSLRIDGVPDPVTQPGKLVVVAVGKAAVPMATGAIDSLGDSISTALAVTKAGIPYAVSPPDSMEILEADHPVPSETSLEAGRRVLKLVAGLTEEDVILMMISGGGSALIEDLVDGVTLGDLRSTTDHMLRAGATINELNAVRRRISKLKGGRLARSAAPARIVNLIVSDVLNSPLQDIASGPTVEPPEQDLTFQTVMERAELVEGLPESVRMTLESQEPTREAWQDNVVGTVILSDAATAARAAIDSAVGLGYRVQSLGLDFQGEAREFGRTWATIARHVARNPGDYSLPLALVGAGELTVTVRGDGAGGRNTEMALAAAREISGIEGVTITSFATDGDDGVSGCAGGIVDGTTVDVAEQAGLDIERSMSESDSASVMHATGEAIDIGPTGTNVNDIYLALIRGPGDS